MDTVALVLFSKDLSEMKQKAILQREQAKIVKVMINSHTMKQSLLVASQCENEMAAILTVNIFNINVICTLLERHDLGRFVCLHAQQVGSHSLLTWFSSIVHVTSVTLYNTALSFQKQPFILFNTEQKTL